MDAAEDAAKARPSGALIVPMKSGAHVVKDLARKSGREKIPGPAIGKGGPHPNVLGAALRRHCAMVAERKVDRGGIRTKPLAREVPQGVIALNHRPERTALGEKEPKAVIVRNVLASGTARNGTNRRAQVGAGIKPRKKERMMGWSA